MEFVTSPRESAQSRGETKLWTAWSADIVSLATLLVLTAVVAWDRLHLEREVSSLDNVTFYIPWFAHLGERLRDGDIPGWLPSVFSGVPFAGDPQSGWMYVPAMLFFSFLGSLTAFKTFVIFHLLLAGISAYVLSRLLGLGQLGSMTAAIAFEFGPLLKYTSCCIGFTQVAAWVPLSLVGVELAVRSRSWLLRSGGWLLAGFALSQELAGWIGQGAYYGFLAAAGFLVFRTLVSPVREVHSYRIRIRDFLVDSVGVYGFALGLGAAGVLPRLDSVSRSSRAAGFTASSDGSFQGWAPEMMLDRLLSVDFGGRWYVGGSVLALAIVAPIIRRQPRAILFFAAYSIITLVLILDRTPLHWVAFMLPWFEILHEHVPSRALLVFWIGPAFLAGATIDTLAESPVSARRLFQATLAMTALFGLGVVYLRRKELDFPNASMESVLLVVGLLLVICLILWQSRSSGSSIVYRAAIVALIMVIAWDMSGRWYGQVVPGNTADAAAARTISTALDPSPSRGAAEFLQEKAATEPPFRYFGYDPGFLVTDNWKGGYRTHYRKVRVQSLLVLNRAITLGLDDIQGYDPVQIDRYSGLFTALNGYSQEYHEINVYPAGISSPLLNLLNSRYIVVPAEIPPGRPDLLHLSQQYPTVYSDRQVRVLENSEALDRAWIVHDAQVAGSDETLNLLSTGSVDPKTTVLLEETPPDMSPASDPSSESVAVDEISGDSLRLTTTALSPGIVVVSESYDPNWKAYVDGEEVDLYVADHAIRAVPIPAGTHVVEMRYESIWLRIGLAISVAFALLAIGIAILIGFRLVHGRKALAAL